MCYIQVSRSPNSHWSAGGNPSKNKLDVSQENKQTDNWTNKGRERKKKKKKKKDWKNFSSLFPPRLEDREAHAQEDFQDLEHYSMLRGGGMYVDTIGDLLTR